MLCGITCSIGLMFLIANLYVTFTADKTKQKQEFYNTLSDDKIEKYFKSVRLVALFHRLGNKCHEIFRALFLSCP